MRLQRDFADLRFCPRGYNNREIVRPEVPMPKMNSSPTWERTEWLASSLNNNRDFAYLSRPFMSDAATAYAF